MTEDDTYKVLKGLTRVEAEKMYDHLFQMGMDSPETITVYDVENFVDKRLVRYGWSIYRLNQE
jgi:hypothetical protein